MRSMLLAFALSTIGCAAPTTLDIGYAGSDEGYSQALAAADYWNSACGTTLVVVHRGDGDVTLREQSGMTNGAFGETKIERPILGALGEKRPVSMWVMRGWQEPVVMTHEFGHALGLGHADHGIMQPGVYRDLLDPATEYQKLLPGLVTEEDCAAVR